MTKQELQEAFEQGLELELDDTNIKIIQIIDNIYFVSFNGSANLLACTIDRFKDAKVISKPKYNGKAVKCDTIEQFKWVLNRLRQEALDVAALNFNENNVCITIENGLCNNEKYFIHYNYEIISFSDYCKEQGIEEPKWNQGFEVMKDNINPEHYKSHPSGVECIEITKHHDFCIGNAIKYLWRAGLKDSSKEVEDMEKAIWYINMKIQTLRNVKTNKR